MSYTICNVYSLPSTYAASSLRAQLYDSANNAVGDEISAGFYKRTGSSTIFAHTLTVPDTHVGWCDVYVAGAPSVIIACIPINPQEIENANIKTSTRGTSTLTTSDIDTRLAAYDVTTQADLTATQTAITDAIAALNNLSQAQAQTAATAALNAYDPPTKAELDTAQVTITTAISGLNNLSGSDILALTVETGHSLLVVLRALYALNRGRSVTDDADNPTEIVYYAPDNSTARVTHTLTDTERTVA